MPENNQILSVEGQLVGMPLAGPESFSQQQLDYLKRALGVDETVLWEDANGASGSSGFPITLSETLSNFESVKFVWQVFNSQYRNLKETLCPVIGTQFVLDGSTYNPGNTGCFTMVYCLSVSNTTLSFDIGRYYKWNGGTNPGEAAPFFSLYKIVGIHRIAGGN